MLTRKEIQALAPGEYAEVMWASHIPLWAPITFGKVHLATAESVPHTLCGRLIAMPSKQGHVRPDDPRCVRCSRARTQREIAAGEVGTVVS